MILEAKTSEIGTKTKIYNADGTVYDLLITKYNTETKEATVYKRDENGRIRMTEWQSEDNQIVRRPFTKTVILDGSYVEIDGQCV